MKGNRKNLIIIPGSCSDRLNWFDQIKFYERQGWQVGFLDLNAAKYKTIQDCANAIELALENLVNEETVIMSHSMGAMLMFKVLVKSKNERLQLLFRKIKIFFIQMPCESKALNAIKATFKLIELVIFFHRLLILWWLEPLLYFLKNIFQFGYRNIFIMPINTSLNFIAMNISFWKASPDEFRGLINYYETWQDIFEKMNFDLSSYEKLYFTYGEPDPVCDSDLIKEIGLKFLNVNILDMTYGFHNPQHYFWFQKRFDDLILKDSNL